MGSPHNRFGMKLDSKYFDRIRMKPDEDQLLRDRVPTCEWLDCERPGKFPAPMGRSREGEYHYFCLDHVRQYNKSYNYFSGMEDSELISSHRQALYGDRPTWRLGRNSWVHVRGGRNRHEARHNGGFRYNAHFIDPFDLVGDGDTGTRSSEPPRRLAHNAERKALRVLGLDENAHPKEVKLQFKRLVKLHHPDANQGCREREEKLIEIIQAYDYLKNSGFL